jgi:hypothetical protein
MTKALAREVLANCLEHGIGIAAIRLQQKAFPGDMEPGLIYLEELVIEIIKIPNNELTGTGLIVVEVE